MLWFFQLWAMLHGDFEPNLPRERRAPCMPEQVACRGRH